MFRLVRTSSEKTEQDIRCQTALWRNSGVWKQKSDEKISMEEGGATPAMLLGSALELLLGPEAAPYFDNVQSLDHIQHTCGSAAADAQ